MLQAESAAGPLDGLVTRWLVAVCVTVSLTTGVWMALDLPLVVIKGIVELSALILLLRVVASGAIPRSALLALVPLVAIAVVGAVGALWPGANNLLSATLFVREILGLSVLLIVGAALGHKSRAFRIVLIIGLVIILIQPLIALIKAFTVGVNEKYWIGTLHQDAGQFGLLLPMIAIATLLPVSFFRYPLIITLLPAFIFFGVVGEKRAIIIVLPIMIFFTAFLCFFAAVYFRGDLNPRWFNPSPIRKLAFFTILFGCAIGSTWGGMTFIESLNPGRGVARLDIVERTDFATDYFRQYMFRDYDDPMNRSSTSVEENENIQYGRFAMIIETVRLVLSFDTVERIFGLGGSEISTSHLLGDERGDIMFERFGLRGVSPMAIDLLVETGFVGLSLFMIWFALIGVMLLLCLRRAGDLYSVIVVLCAIGVHATVALDSFIYSSVAWNAGVVSPSYFLLLGGALSVAWRERVERPGLTPKVLSQMGSSHAA